MSKRAISTQVAIRTAQQSDEAAIRACAEMAYAQYVAAIGKKPAPMVADFGTLITSGQTYVAADADNSVLGFIVFYQKEDHCFLENIAVRPDAGGRGIGKQLIAFCETTAKQNRARSVRLYTNEKMTENLSIYPRLGYRETHRITEDGFNRVYFEKAV